MASIVPAKAHSTPDRSTVERKVRNRHITAMSAKPADPAENLSRRPLENPADPPAGSTGEQPKRPREIGGPKGPEPTRYGDWEVGGRCTDF
jgi:hypothetical protein